MEKVKALARKDPHLTRLFVIFVLVTVVMGALRPQTFLSADNFRSMAVQFPELGFLSISAALVLMSGGIDLSVTGTAVLSGIVAALIMRSGLESGSSPWMLVVIAILAALLTGLICGAMNALLVAGLNITPMLATLGTSNLFTGIGVVLTKGSAISGFPAQFMLIGNGSVFGIPVPLILFILAIVLLSYCLTKTKLGYKLHIYGTNPVASFFSAINNTKVVFSTYLVSGLISSVAGIIMLSRINTAKADFGSSYGLQALLVAVLGGVNPSGGGGKAIGIFMAIITLQFLSSGFNLLHVSSFMKDFTWGVLLVLVMVLNVIQPRIKRKKSAPAGKE